MQSTGCSQSTHGLPLSQPGLPEIGVDEGGFVGELGFCILRSKWSQPNLDFTHFVDEETEDS